MLEMEVTQIRKLMICKYSWLLRSEDQLVFVLQFHYVILCGFALYLRNSLHLDVPSK